MPCSGGQPLGVRYTRLGLESAGLGSFGSGRLRFGCDSLLSTADGALGARGEDVFLAAAEVNRSERLAPLNRPNTH
jgi:hypothetical protein